jgi:CubicO group peptidase (beta-lactamase class C family)
MSDQSRSLPDRPSLRYLKLEAQRRLKAGEFPALYEAQLAIAREHGLPSWAALKELIGDSQPDQEGDSQPDPEGAALEHVRWVVSRFAGAGQPDWSPPGEEELGGHFEESFLSRIRASQLMPSLSSLARNGRLRDEVTVFMDRPFTAFVQAGDVQIQASAVAEPPHRLRGILAHRVGEAVTDARVAAPSTAVAGEVPAEAAAVAEEVFGEFGLPGLALAAGGDGDGSGGDGSGGDGPPWELARGWADLDRDEPLSTAHRFPVYGITTLITATAVLRLVADGRLDLDGPANDHLRTVRLAGDAVTVRDLLTQTGGVDNPAELFAETVPDLVALAGPVLACGGTRGTFTSGVGGYAALGALIADVTGWPYPDAAARLVLDPLEMSSSWFPVCWPGAGARAVTGYMLNKEGSFRPAPGEVGTVQAAMGLWATAADLVRFGVGWSALLPAALAREALRPQVWPGGDTMPAVGLGWRVNGSLGVAGQGGRARGGSASLVMRLDSGQVYVAMTNRSIPIEPVNGRVIRAIAGPTWPV